MTQTEKRMEQALARLDANQSLEHLEHMSDDGDDTAALEALESLAETDPAAAAAIAKVVRKSKEGKGHGNCGSGIRNLKQASVTFKITRAVTKGNATIKDGSAQDVPLPAPLFGVLEYESNYSRVLAAFLPKDGSVAVKSYAKTSDSQGILITYKSTAAGSGDDTLNETILILATNAVYTNLVRGLSSYQFNIVKPKMIISDVLRTDQFDQPINVFNGSMFTAANTDNISPNDYKQEVLSDNTVRVLQDTVCVNPEKTLVPMIVPTTLKPNGSSFYVTFTCPLKDFKIA